MRPEPALRLLVFGALAIAIALISSSVGISSVSAANVDLVFVARGHLATRDDIFADETGPAGQFGTGLPKFAPGSQLMIRHGDGSLSTLVDGANPSPGTGNLIDVQSPDVSFDASRIVFAGATTVDRDAPGYGWRLYEIGVDGTGFRQIPIAERGFTSVPNNNAKQYDYGNYETYGFWNDLFPAYLADGRIVFSSSRYPSRSHYDGRHDYNLYIVNGDGSGVHRITTERGGLLHPTPLPDGRILFARWWNNFNQPSSKGIYNRIDNADQDQTLADGTIIYANPDAEFNPATGRLPEGTLIRDAPNAWHLHVVNTDGSGFARYAFTPYADWARTEDSGNDTYTAAQPALVFKNGTMYIVYTSQQDGTMVHSTHKSGIRIALPGIDKLYANIDDAVVGLSYDRAWNNGDDPPYALHPAGMPNGTILFSYTQAQDNSLPTTGFYVDPVTGHDVDLQGSLLQYKPFTMNLNGGNLAELPVNIGDADAMDAKPIVARSGWSAQTDEFTTNASDDPRQWNLPKDLLPAYAFSQKTAATIQTATIHNPNVYANPPLELPFINNSPPPGSIASAEVWVDANQFTGAYCYVDWPKPCDYFQPDDELRAIKYNSVGVSTRGEFTAEIPADVPAFIVLRDSNGRAVSGWNRGYISIAQGNAYARPGQTVTCIGCHMGHVSGSITNEAQATAGWTNVAPYATATASSENEPDDQYQPFDPSRVIDRRGFVPIPNGGPGGPYQDEETGWMSDTKTENPEGQWVQLDWNTPVKVSQLRLVGPPPTGGDWGGFGDGPESTPYHITQGKLEFWLDNQKVGNAIATGPIESLSDGDTLITLQAPTVIDRLKFTVNAIEGYWYWSRIAALNEIEVIGMAGSAGGGPPPTTNTATRTATATKTPRPPTKTPTATPTVTGTSPGLTITPSVTETPSGTPDACSQKPTAPSLASPPNDERVATLRVKLEWGAVDCVDTYKVKIRQDSATGQLAMSKNKLETPTWTTRKLEAGNTYYWRVFACNAAGCEKSKWSEFVIKKGAK